jgi:hypothetical protein
MTSLGLHQATVITLHETETTVLLELERRRAEGLRCVRSGIHA